MDSDSYPAENSGRLSDSIVSNTVTNDNKQGAYVWTRR